MKRLCGALAVLTLVGAAALEAGAYGPVNLTPPAQPVPAAPPAAAAPSQAPAPPPAQYYVPALPARLSLCGTPVPLERSMVAEQLDRELVIVAFDPAQVVMWYKRAGRYFPYIESRLRAAGLPDDLKYLAVAESSLIHYIRSASGAVGPWQFMAETGRGHGLRIDRWYDDRRNVILSTKAALTYLQNLHKQFGSWPLAMAAYNCGERRLAQEIKEQGTRDYFELALPRETQRYLYRIMAAKLVLGDPQRYGYVLPPTARWKPLPGESVTLVLKRPVHLTAVARAANTSYRRIQELNPELRQRHLPKGRVTIVVPPGQAQGLIARMNKGGPLPGIEKEVYVVRRGDSLSTIAHRHGVTVDELKDANELEGDCIIVVGQRLNIPEK